MVIQSLFNGYSVGIILLIFLDQAIKSLAIKFFPQVVSHNMGIAFGIFPSDLWLFFNIFIIFGIVLLIKERLTKTLIVSGGFSNIIDRIIRGGVVDYIDLKIDFLKFLFPTFNLADVFICLGLSYLIVKSLMIKKD